MLSSRSLTLGLAVLVLAPLPAACDRQSPATPQPQPTARSIANPVAAEPAGAIDRSHAGEPLPTYTVGDASGARLALATLKGRPVLINLWATWCAPCVAELPTLDRLAAAGGTKVVTVSQDMETARVPAFLRARGGTHLPAWLDADAGLSARYQAATLPMTILYGADGRERWRWVGGNDWASAEAGRLLAEAGR